MLLYKNKKYLIIFFKLNSYIGQSNKIKQIFSYKYLYFYRYNYGLINLSKKLLNLKFFLNFFKRLVFLNCRFFFISPNLEYSKLIFFYAKKLRQYCFVGNWISGLMSNLNERFNNIFFDNFQSEFSNLSKLSFFNKFYLNSKLNKEIRFFKNKNYKKLNKKIDIVFFIGSNNSLIDLKILKECFKLKVPVIGYFNSNSYLEYSSYFIITNILSFFNIYFLFLVFIRYYIYLQNKYYNLGKINLLSKHDRKKKLKANFFKIKSIKKLKKF